MSIKAMNWAFGLELKPVKKVILLALADSADDDGRCWPGKKYLAKKCSVAEKTITRQIEDLQAMGLVKVIHRKQGEWNKTNLYQLNLQAEVVNNDGVDTPENEEIKPSEGGDNLSLGGDKMTLQTTKKGRDKMSPPRDTTMTPPGDTGVPLTIKNHKTLTHTETHASELESFDQRFSGDVDALPESRPELNQPVSRKFAMYSNWQPDHTFTDQAKTLGLDLTTLTSEQGESVQIALEDFRTWWMESRSGTQETQRLWQQKFIQTSLKRELEKQRGNTHGNGHQKHSGQHSGSAMSRPYTADDFDLDATW